MEEKLRQFFENNFLTPASETSRSFVFNCPACGGKEKLYIEKDTGESVCFKHGSASCPHNRSKPEYSLHVITKKSIKEIKDFLYQERFVIKSDFKTFNEIINEDVKKQNDDLLPGTLEMHFESMLDANNDGAKYLINRGITFEQIRKYEIMYSSVMRRVIFPVVMKNTLYGWQGRAIDPVHKDYRMHNMPGPWKAQTLMFYNTILNQEIAILAEGPIDALKFEKVGHFVASMGKGISQKQLDLIIEAKVKKLYLALDRDADDKLERIYLQMKHKGVETFLMDIPSHREDFGACTFDECLEAFNNAKPVEPSNLLPMGAFE